MRHKAHATLNLCDGFKQFGKALEFKSGKFPAGEVYFNCVVPFDVSVVRVNIRLHNDQGIMLLCMALDSLRRQGVDTIEVFTPYLPYSRQDRVCNEGDAFSLSVLCSIVRSLQVCLVTYDIHSNVTEVLLDSTSISIITNHKEVRSFVDSIRIPSGKTLVLVAPDAGARKKADALFSTGIFDDIIYANKTRVGNLIICDPLDGYYLQDATCIVVDDICDEGSTFNALGRRLQEAGCKESYLFVSHGIFSKGVYELSKHYKQIGTTNSFLRHKPTEYVKVFSLDY